MGYDLTVVLPTLNEAANIRTTINRIFDVTSRYNINTEILVVDDDSKDGTIDILNDIAAVYPSVHVLVRLKDHGLSASVVDGFTYAAAPFFIVMDADGQHPFEVIPPMYLALVDGADIVIGSRYTEGGGVGEWGLLRRMVSDGATYIARLLFPNVKDPVSGLFGLRRDVVQRAELYPKGYKILMEVLGKGHYTTVTEIPIVFGSRVSGKSKLGAKIILEYLEEMIRLYWYSLWKRDSPGHAEIARVCKFMLVGASGIFVNMFILILTYEHYGVDLFFASMISTEVSILTNFSLNNAWTFKGVATKLGFLGRLAFFNFISIGGILVTAMTLFVLVKLGMYYLFANLIGIFMAFVWNFVANRTITWSPEK